MANEFYTFQIYENAKKSMDGLLSEMVESYKDQPISTLLEELEQHFVEIFTHGLACCVEILELHKERNIISDEFIPDLDIFSKLMHILELLVSEHRSLLVVVRSVEENTLCIRLLFELISMADDVKSISSMLHIIKKIIGSVKIISSIFDARGMKTLLVVFNRYDDMVILQQTVLIITLLVGNYRFNGNGLDQPTSDIHIDPTDVQRTRTYSTSSAGSYAGRMSAGGKQLRRQSKNMTSLNQIIESGFPITPQSNSNIAWNVFSEIIKMTPLSAAWITNDAKFADESKKDGTSSHEDNVLFSMCLMLSSMEIINEQQLFNTAIALENDEKDEIIPNIDFERMFEDAIEASETSVPVEQYEKLIDSAFKKSITPSDAINTLNFLSVLTISNLKFQQSFTRLDILHNLFAMLERVESNLTLLAPCRDTSRAVASTSGVSSHSAHTDPADTVTFTSFREKDHFHSFAGNEFDDYYSHLMGILLQLLLDEVSMEKIVSAMNCSSSSIRTMKIKNLQIMKLIKVMLCSRHITLFTVAMKVVYFLIRINPSNSVTIHAVGVNEILLLRLYGLIHFGRIDYDKFEASLPDISSMTLCSRNLSCSEVSSEYTPTSNNNAFLSRDNSIESDLYTMDQQYFKSTASSSFTSSSIGGGAINSSHVQTNSFTVSALQLTDEILSLLQLMAPCLYQKGDNLILNALCTLLMSAWVPMGHVFPHKLTKYTKKCMNCEIENATRECVHESCIRDKCFRLCEECDLVFHKSTMKKRHIRIPTLTEPVVHTNSKSSPATSSAVTAPMAANNVSNISISGSTQSPSEELSNQDIFNWERIFEDLSKPSSQLILSAILTNNDTSLLCSKSSRSHQDVIVWKEMLSNLLAVTIRTILDDQKGRGVPLSSICQTTIAFSLRHMMFETSGATPSSTVELEKSFHQIISRFPDLDVNKPMDSSSSPPEINHTRLKRLLFCLKLQILSRHIVMKDINEEKVGNVTNDQDVLNVKPSNFGGIYLAKESTAGSQRESLRSLQTMNTLGLFPALLYFVTDESSFIPLTFADRHYILWLFRESCISSITLQYAGAYMMLEWFGWMLMPNGFISHKLMKTESSLQGIEINNIANLSSKNLSLDDFIQKTKGHNKFYFAWLPLGLANINSTVRLFLLQELRLLVTSCMNLSDKYVKNIIFSIDYFLKQVDSSRFVLTNYSRNSSPYRKRSATLIPPEYTAVSNSAEIKKILSATGIIQILLFCIFESSYWRLIKSHSSHGSEEDRRALLKADIAEIDREIWWSSIVLLGELIADCEEAKLIVEKEYGIAFFAKWIIQVIDILKQYPEATSFNELALSKLIAELCLKGNRVLLSKSSYDMCSLAFPKTQININHLYKSQSRVGDFSQSLNQISFIPRSINLPIESEETSVVADKTELCSFSNIYYTYEQVCQWMQGSFHAALTNIENSALCCDYTNEFVIVRNFSFLPLTAIPENPQKARKSKEDLSDGSPLPDSLKFSRSRKNLSSISLQTPDIESRWESESVGRISISHEMTSRSSMNSHQSITAIMQAMKSTPVHLILQTDDLHAAAAATTTLTEMTESPTLDFRLSISRETVQHNSTIHHEFPFPSFSAADHSLSHSMLLYKMNNLGFISFNKSLVLLHNALLLRSGLYAWLGDENIVDDETASNCGSVKHSVHGMDGINEYLTEQCTSFPALKSVDGYYFMLKKHLSLYMEPVDKHNEKYATQIHTNLNVRSAACLETLLTFASTSSPKSQTYLLELIYTILDANPANAYQASNNNTVCFILAKLLSVNSSRLQDLCGSLLSLILNYSANAACVKYLLSSTVLSQDIKSNLTLYVLGKSCEFERPKSFLYFDLCDSIAPKFSLPTILNISQYEKVKLNISTWLRLANFGNYPIMSLLNFVHEESGFCIHVYFRNVIQDSKEHLSEDKNNIQQAGQLCISIIRSVNISQQNLERSTIISAATGASESAWLAALSHLLEVDGDQFDYDSHQPEKYSNVLPAIEVIAAFALPDIIIDYSWPELGDWHLLNLQLQEDSVSCFIDGNEANVLYFSPFGYSSSAAHSLSKSESLLDMHKMSEAVSKEKPLVVHFGGFSIPTMKDINITESPLNQEVKIFMALRQSVTSFCGFLSDILIFEGEHDLDHILNCVREGPQICLKRPNGKVLSSFTQADIVSFVEYQKVSAKSVANSAGGSIIPTTKAIPELQPMWKDLKNMQIFAPQFNQLKQGDSLLISTDNLLSVSNHTVQVHRNDTLLFSYKLLGGLKIFFPLLVRDVSIVVANLRILSGLIFHEETYQEMKLDSIDKVFFYALSRPHLQVIEVYQVLFDMIIRANVGCSHKIIKPPLDITDKIVRVELLSVLMDIAVAAYRNYAVGRAVLDWLRTLCEHVKDNIPRIIKTIGLHPIMILFSAWSLGNSSEVEFVEKERSGSLNAAKSISMDTDRRKVSFIEQQLETLYGGKSDIPGPLEDATTVSSNTANLPPNNFKPIDPLYRGNAAAKSEPRQEKADDWMGMYRLQLSGMKFLRVLIYGTCNDSHIIDSLKYMQTGNIDSFAATFSPLLSYVIAAARPKHEQENDNGKAQPHKFNDQARRSEKVKATIRHNFTMLPILKNIELGDNRYWQLSTGLIILNEILKLVGEDALSAAFILPIKNSLSVYNLGYVALDLLASPSVEMREAALRLLAFHFTGIDGKLDTKSISLFDKQHGFQFMAQLLCQHLNDSCDEIILERLLSLLFWQSSTQASVDSSEVSAGGDEKPALSSTTAGRHVTTTRKKEFIIPQMLEVIFKVLSFARHADQIHTTFYLLLECVGGINTIATGSTMHHSNTPAHHRSNVAVEMDEIATKNIESFYQQKDWIIWIADLINHFQRQSHQYATTVINGGGLNPNGNEYTDVMNSGAGSLSESESVANTNPYSVTSGSASGVGNVNTGTYGGGGGGGGNTISFTRHDSFFSEENSSTFDDSVGTSEDGVPGHSASSTPHLSSANYGAANLDPVYLQQRFLQQYTQSVYKLLGHIFTFDFIQKYHATNRRWTEFFRLSLPEHSYVQEEILHTLLDSMISCPYLTASTGNTATASSSTVAGTPPSTSSNAATLSSSPPSNSTVSTEALQAAALQEYGLNYLRNIGYFFEQLLERNKLHVKLCLSILQTLHNLTYYCSIDLRNKLPKETILPEIRKQLLLRCLIEVGQDLHIRIYAYDKLQSSISAYLATTESNKMISDQSIVILFCGMFVESFEDLECIVGCTNNTASNASSVQGMSIGYDTSFDEYTAMMSGTVPAMSSSAGTNVQRQQQQHFILQQLHQQQQRSMEVHQGIRNSISMMQTILSLIQLCVQSSNECKKTMNKLIEGIHTDFYLQVATIFQLKSLPVTIPLVCAAGSSTSSANTITISSSSGSSSQLVSNATTNSATDSATPVVTSSLSSWWYWGSSSTSTTAATKNDGLTKSNSINEDIERGGSGDDKTFAASSPGSSSPNSTTIATAQSSSSSSSSLPPSFPTDVKSFVYWYCSSDRRELQQEFRNRILKELKPVLRSAEKLRERYSQRILKYTKTLQDRRTKDKTMMTKTVQDLSLVIQSYHDKMKSTSMKDIQSYIKTMKDRYHSGRDIFYGLDANSKATLLAMRSPGSTKDIKVTSTNILSVSNPNIPQHLIHASSPLIANTMLAWQQEFESIQLPDIVKAYILTSQQYDITTVEDADECNQIIKKPLPPRIEVQQAFLDYLSASHATLDLN